MRNSVLFVFLFLFAVVFLSHVPLVNGQQISHNCRFGNDSCETDVSVESVTIGSADLNDQIINMQIGGITISANHNFTAQVKVPNLGIENFAVKPSSSGWYIGSVSDIRGNNVPVNQTFNFWPFDEYSLDILVYVHENNTSYYTNTIRTGFEQELTYQKTWQVDGSNESQNHNATSNQTTLHYVINLRYSDSYRFNNLFIAAVFIVIPIVLFISHIFMLNLSREKHVMMFSGAIAVMVFILFTVRQYVTSGYSINELIISLTTICYSSFFLGILIYRKRQHLE